MFVARIRLLLLLLLSVGTARADEAPRPRAFEPAAPLTAYAAGPLRQAQLVVVGRTREVRTHRHQQLARVEVVKALLGTPPTRPLTVMVRGPHPASDLRKQDTTSFPPVGSGEHVFFLGQEEHAIATDFHDSFPVEGLVGKAKIEALETEIRLARVPRADVRAARTLQYLVSGLGAKSPWMRAHATRELIRFAKARRDLISEALEERLHRRAKGRLRTGEREDLDALLAYLGKTRRVEGAPEAPEGRGRAGADPWRAAYLRASAQDRALRIQTALREPRGRDLRRLWWAYAESDAGGRREIVRGLVRRRVERTLPQLLAKYAGEEDRSVREEIVRATGLLGDTTDVDWLAARAENPLLARTALLALARIRSPSAVRVLARIQAQLEQGATPESKRRARWIAYLRSKAFAESALMR